MESEAIVQVGAVLRSFYAKKAIIDNSIVSLLKIMNDVDEISRGSELNSSLQEAVMEAK